MPPSWVLEEFEALERAEIAKKQDDSSDNNKSSSSEAVGNSNGKDESPVSSATEVDLSHYGGGTILYDPSNSNASSDPVPLAVLYPPHIATKVKFDLDNLAIQTVRGRHEMGPDEYNNTWYRNSDFSRISSWNRMTIKLYKQGRLEDEPDHCLRGLEHRIRGHFNEQRQANKVNSIYAVLAEQAKQRKSPTTKRNEGVIAEAYRVYVYTSLAHAQEVASQDAKDAKQEDPATATPTSTLPARRREGMRRRSSVLMFEEDDLKDLDVPDEQAEVEPLSSFPVAHKIGVGETSTDENATYQATEEESFKVKAKKESRLKRLFFRRKSTKSGPESQHVTNTATGGNVSVDDSSAERRNQQPRKVRLRRSSM